jgi:O-antigen/teichoic acid export membrane protein
MPLVSGQKMSFLNQGILELIIGRMAQFVFGLGIIKVGTHYLGEADLGNFFLLTAIMGYFSLVFINPIGVFFNRMLHSWREEKILKRRLIQYNLFILFVSFILVPVIIYIMGFSFQFSKYQNILTVGTIAISVFVNTWFFTLVPMLNMFGERRQFVILTNMALLLNIAISFLFVFFYRLSPITFLLSQTISQLLLIIPSIKILSKKGILLGRNVFQDETSRTSLLKEVLSFSSPLLIVTFFSWFQGEGFRFLVESIFSVEMVGIVVLGLMLSQKIGTAVEGIVHQTLLPIFYSQIKTKDPLIIENSGQLLVDYGLIPLLVTAFGTFLFSHSILALFANDSYVQSLFFIGIGAWTFFFRSLSALIGHLSHISLKTKKLIYPNVCSSIALSIFLIAIKKNSYSIYSVGYALLFCYFINLIITFIAMKKIVKVSLLTKRIVKSFLGNSLFSAIFYVVKFNIKNIYIDGILLLFFIALNSQEIYHFLSFKENSK